jgi:hypothetical protein
MKPTSPPNYNMSNSIPKPMATPSKASTEQLRWDPTTTKIA